MEMVAPKSAPTVNERAEQAARQHARQDAAEQREIAGQDRGDAGDPVAPPDQHDADRDQHADRDHRPADRLSDAPGTRFSVRGGVGWRRVFQRDF
jgi:hypothetical protein